MNPLTGFGPPLFAHQWLPATSTVHIVCQPANKPGIRERAMAAATATSVGI